MGIVRRFLDLIRSNVNEALSRAQDPELMLNQTIREMDDHVTRARQDTARAMADEDHLHGEVESAAHEVLHWRERAEQAVRAGRDDLARSALQRSETAIQRAKELHGQWDAQVREVERLKAELTALSSEVERVKRHRNTVVARYRASEAHRHLRDTMDSISGTGTAAEAFRRLEAGLTRDVAEAHAMGALTTDPLEHEFHALESEAGTDEGTRRLVELKREMGLLAPPPS